MNKVSKSTPSAKRTLQIQGIITNTAYLLRTGKPCLVVILCPWHEPGAPAQRSELRVEVPAKSEAAAKKGMETWRGKTVALAYEQVRKARGHFLDLNVARSPLRRVATSEILSNEQAVLARPRSTESSVLGILVLDRQLGWFEGSRRRAGHEYQVTIEVDDPDDDKQVERAVGRAEELVRGVEKALPAIRQSIADELLDTYNDVWRGQAPRLSVTGFKRRQVLQSIGVGKQGITAHFGCDGLFTGHGVEVRMSSRLKIQEVLVA